jgi:hypothetical protein
MRIAEIARQPAPALHVDDDGIDWIGNRVVLLLLAVERAPRIRSERAVVGEIGAGLERLDRVAHGIVVERAVWVFRYFEPLAQRDHTFVFHTQM